MRPMHSRALALLLAMVMVLSMIPVPAFAEGNATTWTKVDFSAFTAEDTVAITMSKDGVTYVLPTTAAGSGGQPMAEIGTVEGNTLTTTGDGFGRTIAPTEGGFTIQCGDGYLYTTNANNGTRIGETAAVWNLDAESNYLATDVEGTMRYLGVYVGKSSADWRCYKTWASGNTAGQTIGYWVKGAGAVGGKRVDDPPAGLDNIDWQRVFAILYAGKYTGGLSIEPHSATWRGALGEPGVDFTLQYIRHFLLGGFPPACGNNPWLGDGIYIDIAQNL